MFLLRACGIRGGGRGGRSDRGGNSSQVLYTPTSAERTGYFRCGRAIPCHLDTGGAEAWSGIPFALFPPFLRGGAPLAWLFLPNEAAAAFTRPTPNMADGGCTLGYDG
jgi:hypothetical protein